MSQPTIPTTGDYALDGELLDLRRRIDALERRLGEASVATAQPTQTVGPGFNGAIEVKSTDGTFDSQEQGLEFLQSDFTLSQSANNAKVAAITKASVLFDHFADVNNGTTVETDLYTDTLTAGLLAANGQKVYARYAGIFVGDATSTQRLRAYFCGTAVLDTGALGIGVTTTYWDLELNVIRVSSSVVRVSAALNTSFASLAAYAVYTEVTGLTLANTQVVKITGQAAGVTGASNQITAKLGYGTWLKAA